MPGKLVLRKADDAPLIRLRQEQQLEPFLLRQPHYPFEKLQEREDALGQEALHCGLPGERFAKQCPGNRQDLRHPRRPMPRQAYTEAVLGVYELNKVDLLKDLFLWAYERSAARYAAVRHAWRARSVQVSLSDRAPRDHCRCDLRKGRPEGSG